MVDAPTSDTVTFVIRNPSKHDSDSFKISVALNSSLADIQKIISEQYDGKPSPSTQTLIYAGKVLKDTTLTVKDIIKQPIESDVPHSLHLVVRTPAMKQGASSSSAGMHVAPGSINAGPASLTSAAPAPCPPAQQADPAAVESRDTAATTSSSSSVGSGTAVPQQEAGPGSASSSNTPSSGVISAPVLAGADSASTHAISPVFEFGGSSSSTMPAVAANAHTAGPGIPYPYMFLNPMNMNPMMNNQVMAAAYQAAYAAALQSMRQQTQPHAAAASSSMSTSQALSAAPLVPLTAPLTPALLYYPAAYQQAAAAAAMAAAAAAQQGQQGQAVPAPMAVPAPFAIPAHFAVPLLGLPAHLAAAHPSAAGGAAQQAAQPAAAGAAEAPAAPAVRVGLRQRFPAGFYIARGPAAAHAAQQQAAAAAGGGAPGAGGQQQAGGPHPHVHGHRRYRTRTITFRISMRTLLQMLVFGMVLYQHCTWPRLCILLAGSVILYATALWAPFRQFILSLAMPPRPEQLAEIQRRRQQQYQQGQAAAAVPPPAGGGQAVGQEPAPAAAGDQQQQQEGAAAPAARNAAPLAAVAVGGGGAPAAAGVPAGGAGPNLPVWLQQGIIREILTVIVSFVTSLLPAWNYNAEDAAVFAAAQEMMAREAREQAQQQQGGAGGGGGNAGDGVAAAVAP